MPVTKKRNRIRSQLESEKLTRIEERYALDHLAGLHDDKWWAPCPHCHTRDLEILEELDLALEADTHVEPDPKNDDVTQGLLPLDVVNDFRAGASIKDLCERAGMKRGKLRRTLAKILGDDMKRERTKKSELRNVGYLPNDRDAPRIDSARKIDGWSSRQIFVDVGGPPLKDCEIYLPWISTTVFVSPDGDEYVIAAARETADLIYDNSAPGLAPVRLRRYDTSAIARQVQKNDSLTERGEQALERKRNNKRARRTKRKVT